MAENDKSPGSDAVTVSGGQTAKTAFRRFLLPVLGWSAFALGWIGVFLPGLPTTVFWIVAALVFLKTNPRMYAKIIANRRFGPGIRLFVEEGRIRTSGKIISICAMLGFAAIGALAIPALWAKLLVLFASLSGSVWVFLLPTPKNTTVE